MPRIPETDLILNADGSIYHLGLFPEQISDIIIAVGDPDRVDRVTRRFESIEFASSKREFRTQGGTYKGKRVTVISSGIGNDNVEIMLTELDALVNIDFASRTPRPVLRKLNIIRIGTSGSLRPEIPVGAFIASDFAVGTDTLMRYYPLPQDDEEYAIAADLREKQIFPGDPYVVRGSTTLREQFAYDMQAGNTVTAPGFYAPQGRILRLPVRYPDLLNRIDGYVFRPTGFRFHNFEMETSGYYAMGRIMGHEMLSVNAILANRSLQLFAEDPGTILDKLIQVILDRI